MPIVKLEDSNVPIIGRTMGATGGKQQRRIVCVGPIHLETQVFWLGVVPGEKSWYVYRNGNLFEWTKHKLTVPAVDPKGLQDGAISLWADALCREFLDKVTLPNRMRQLHPMYSRYRKLVQAFVHAAIVKCAAADVEREAHHFARGCCRDWAEGELTSGQPTILHATYVSLVLGLDDDDAAQLIEYAGFLEWRVPLWQRETARMIFQEARRLLSSMLPAWWAQGVAFDWDMHATSVHDIFTKQFLRLANDAADRSIPVDTLIATQRALTQLGASPTTARYLSRTEDIDRKALEDLDKLLGS